MWKEGCFSVSRSSSVIGWAWTYQYRPSVEESRSAVTRQALTQCRPCARRASRSFLPSLPRPRLRRRIAAAQTFNRKSPRPLYILDLSGPEVNQLIVSGRGARCIAQPILDGGRGKAGPDRGPAAREKPLDSGLQS